jgi:ribosome-binding factor A
MSRRVEQINEQLRLELANLIARNLSLDDGLITIIYVKTTADLRYAKIGISVLPMQKSGSALKQLRHHNSVFTGELRKKLNMKFIPKFNWVIDSQERYAIEIEKVLDNLKIEEEQEGDERENYEPREFHKS